MNGGVFGGKATSRAAYRMRRGNDRGVAQTGGMPGFIEPIYKLESSSNTFLIVPWPDCPEKINREHSSANLPPWLSRFFTVFRTQPLPNVIRGERTVTLGQTRHTDILATKTPCALDSRDRGERF